MIPQFRDLFNGKDLSGWVNVNTAKDTWQVQDGILACSGQPIGVLRTDRQYENFILQLDWMHLEAGGNSGCFVWCEGTVPEGKQLPRGVEVQILELEWAVQHNQTDAYVHGEIFGTGGIKTQPDNPRGERSKSAENRCKGKGQWNNYTIVCVDGTIKLAVNGKFVNGISNSQSRRATSAWNPRALPSASATSGSWNCLQASHRRNGPHQSLRISSPRKYPAASPKERRDSHAKPYNSA